MTDSVWRPSFFCCEAADSCRLACGRQFLIFARRNALFPGISSECGGICRGACGSGCICDFIAPCPFYRTLTTVPGTLPPASENYNEKINDSAYETKENAFIHALPARAVFPPGAAGTCCPGRCEPRCREFRARLEEFVARHAAAQGEAAEQIRLLIGYDGREVSELSTGEQMPVRTLELLWQFLTGRLENPEMRCDLFIDLFFQFQAP